MTNDPDIILSDIEHKLAKFEHYSTLSNVQSFRKAVCDLGASVDKWGSFSDFVASIQRKNAGDAFSQAARDIANGVWSPSDQHLHERLMVQLQKDADEIRETCAIVRDPNEPRVVTYKSGEDLMAVTRRLCLGR